MHPPSLWHNVVGYNIGGMIDGRPYSAGTDISVIRCSATRNTTALTTHITYAR